MVSAKASAGGPIRNRSDLGACKDSLVHDAAMDGVGPLWRIRAASVKHEACVTCHVTAGKPCKGPQGTHPSRIYQHAAAKRRARSGVTPERVEELRGALKVPTAETLAEAIECGVVRLHVPASGNYDDATWVDA